MGHKDSKTSFIATVPLRCRGRMRWAARICALLIALFAATMAIGSAVADQDEPVTWTGIGVAMFVAWILLSMLTAWRWERLGGISGILNGVGFGLFVFFTAGRNEAIAAVALGAPIMAVGIGFLLAERETVGGREAPSS